MNHSREPLLQPEVRQCYSPLPPTQQQQAQCQASAKRIGLPLLAHRAAGGSAYVGARVDSVGCAVAACDTSGVDSTEIGVSSSCLVIVLTSAQLEMNYNLQQSLCSLLLLL